MADQTPGHPLLASESTKHEHGSYASTQRLKIKFKREGDGNRGRKREGEEDGRERERLEFANLEFAKPN